MQQKPPIPERDEPYQGASDATIALGKGKIYSWIGSAAGVVVGALTSGHFSGSIEKYAPSATRLLQKLNIPIEPKNVIRAAGGLAGLVIGSYTGLAIGVARGMKTASVGREQFERVKGERNDALDRVKALEAAAAAHNGVVVKPPSEFTKELPSRAAQGSHAASVEAEALAATATQQMTR
ncbi:MAG: hypothetical protein SFW64_04865 [Alphaproteobacteria bacterium]|nr:hypothetical protein [Alphaproteobacteria bacterium]